MRNPSYCLTNCYQPFEPVPACIRYLKIATTVVSGPLEATITDKFVHQYLFLLNTDAQGFALLDTEADYLPIGLFSAYGGPYELRVTQTNGEALRFPAAEDFHECLRFQLTQSYAPKGVDPDPLEVTTYPTYQFPYVYEVVL